MQSILVRLATLFVTFFGGVLLVSTPVFALNTWETVTPNGASGTFRAVVSAGNYVYLATSNTVYGSSNNGTSWTNGTGLPGTSINGIAIAWLYDGSSYAVDASTPVYVATDNGVYESTLGSSTWNATTLSGFAVYDVHVDQFMAVSGSPTTLYAGTSDGVYRSNNAGVTWTHINAGIEGVTITDLTSDFASGVIYARASTGDIYRSDLFSALGVDENWAPVDGSANDVTLLNALGSVTWLATTNGILKDDGSNAWASTNVGMPSGSIATVASDYTDSNIAYAVHGSQGIYRTTTEALATLPDAQWVSFNANLAPASMLDVVTNPLNSAEVYAMRSNALYRMELSDVYVDLTPPSAITDLGAVMTTDTIATLTWTQPGDDDAYGTPTSYDVRYATTEIEDENDWNNATQVDGEPTPYGDTADLMDIENVPTNTRHYFAVRAIDDAGNMGPISNVAYAGENTSTTDTTAPSVPNGLSVSAVTQTSFTLSWNASTDNVGVAGYRVYRAIGAGSLVEVGTVTSGTSFAHTGLSAGTSYSLAVRAYDAVGNQSALSTTITGTTASASGGGSSGGSSGGGGGGGGSSSRDDDAPTNTSVRINGDAASTASQSVTLTLSARDDSTPIVMQISNTTSFSGASWVRYATSYSWTLTAGAGTKTVYVRFRDDEGNTSKTVSDTITLTGAGAPTATQTPTPSVPKGTVQGTAPYAFTTNLGLGAEGTAVVELQKRLRTEGFFTYPTNTGYYGPATAAAVQAYQRKYGIDTTGFVGPMTREKLNGAGTPAGDDISLIDFVRLLIAVGVIPPEKAALALSVLEDLN